MNENNGGETAVSQHHRLRHVIKILVRGSGVVVFVILLGIALQQPGAATAVPLVQDDPTPTEVFNVIPPTDEGQGDDSETTPTEEPPATVIESATVTPDIVLAEELPEGWLPPLNLSLSGATTDPQMVRDSNGNFHVLWYDAIDGFIYTSGLNELWSVPLAPELPFATRRFFPDLEAEDETPLFRPHLVADSRGRIHAFWIDNFEEQQTLYHSSVPASSFEDFDSWSARESLESAALKVAVSAGSDGVLHLIYIRTAESSQRPSGIYYRRLSPSSGWSNPVLLYGSRYLRGVTLEEANLQILANGNGYVYVVWDDTRREQVFFMRSANGGTTWNPSQEIDRRSLEDAEEVQGPSQIRVGADGDTALLTWRGGHEPGRECTQYVMASEDSGENWSLRQFVESLPDCFTSSQFVPTGQGLFLMGTTEQEGPQQDDPVVTTYLMAWDGSRWSDPQVQELLTSFTNPDTFQPVRLRCHYAVGEGAQMQTIGCDTGNGRDIWLTAREIGPIGDWFPPPPIWQGPDSIGSTSVETVDLLVIADEVGGAHAIWHGDQSPEIYHAAWNGQSWSAGRPVVSAPNGSVQEIAAAAGNGRLYLVFRDSATGLHFSDAAAARPSEWSEPLRLVENQPTAGSPSIIAGRGGDVHVAYAVPLNEPRGIYLIQSDNSGETWTLPLQVFNGTVAEWDMVDSPYLAATGEDQLHLLWTRRSLPPDAAPLALAYSRSEDLGRSWTEAEVVVETPVVWSRLLGLDARFVHRLWAEESNERLVIWHAYSQDNGLNWSRAAQVTGLPAETYPAVAVDSGSRPHILGLDNGRLLDLLWSEERWIPGDDLGVPFVPGGLLAAAGDSNEQLLALYAGQIPGTNVEEEVVDELYAMSRSLEIPPELLIPLPTLTPTPVPTATPGPSPTPTPEPTLAFSAEQERGLVQPIPGLPAGTDASASLILLAIIPTSLILLISIIVGVRIARRR